MLFSASIYFTDRRVHPLRVSDNETPLDTYTYAMHEAVVSRIYIYIYLSRLKSLFHRAGLERIGVHYGERCIRQFSVASRGVRQVLDSLDRRRSRALSGARSTRAMAQIRDGYARIRTFGEKRTRASGLAGNFQTKAKRGGRGVARIQRARRPTRRKGNRVEMKRRRKARETERSKGTGEKSKE